MIILRLIAAACVAVLAGPALAEAPALTTMPPMATPRQPELRSVDSGVLTTSATLAGSNLPIRSGLTWRVFRLQGDSTPELVARSSDAIPHFSLAPGNYMLHVSYGFASAMKRVTFQGNAAERLSISCGALKVSGVIGDKPIPTSKLTFSVYVPVGADAESRLVVADAKPGDLIRLPEGSYHIVSTYGDSNAIMRTDLKVEAGKVTEATINHRAATVTLKLVNAPGGEAFAGTAFSVLTPGGDVIREAIGAFPSFILAEGDYVLIARHEGQVYTREFKVESGVDRDIEIVAR